MELSVLVIDVDGGVDFSVVVGTVFGLDGPGV